MGESVFARVFSISPKAARQELQQTFGEQFERWVHAAGVRPTDLADSLGFERTHVYKLFRGALPIHASWLWIMPPALLKVVLTDLAGSIGYELRPASGEELPHDYDHALDGVAYLRELTDCLRVRAEHEADGRLSPHEIDVEIAEIEQAEKLLTRRKAFLRRAKLERGGIVLSIIERLRGRRTA